MTISFVLRRALPRPALTRLAGLPAALVLAAILSACSDDPSPDVDRDEPDAPLAEAVTLLPSGSTTVFTDWSRIKDDEDLTDVASESSLEDRTELLTSIQSTQATPSTYAVTLMASHADDWGWDTTDLEWEATTAPAGSLPVHVLKVRDDLDLDTVQDKLAAAAESEEDADGATVYSIPVMEEWMGKADLAMANTAVLPDEHLIVLSGDADEVADVLGRVGGEPSDPAAAAATSALGPVNAAMLVPADDACGIDPAQLITETDPETAEQLMKKYDEAAAGPDYRMLAVGYAYTDGAPVDKVVFEYADADAADEALTAREQLLTDGSAADGQPYSSLFEVSAVEVEGQSVVAELAPADDRPGVLFSMVTRRDLLFAAC